MRSYPELRPRVRHFTTEPARRPKALGLFMALDLGVCVEQPREWGGAENKGADEGQITEPHKDFLPLSFLKK